MDNDIKHTIIIAAAFVVGMSILAGILTENLLFGFSAIAFAILFHAIVTE